MGEGFRRPFAAVLTVGALLASLLVAQAVLAPSAAAVTTVVVNTTADVVDADPATTSLREAVNEANSDAQATEIVLAPSATYQLTICGATEHANAGGDLDHTESAQLTVFGNGSTIEQTCPGERVLHHLESTQALVVDATTITGGNVIGTEIDLDGHSIGGGGGILSLGSALLSSVVVTANSAEDLGSGVRALFPSTFTNSTIDANPGTGGGAAIGLDNDFEFAPNLISITGSSFDGNGGAGLLAYQGIFSGDTSTFNGNGTDGIFLKFAISTFTDIEINNNTGSGLGSIDAGVTFIDSSANGNGTDGIRSTGAGLIDVSGSDVIDNGAQGLHYIGCDGLGMSDVITVSTSNINDNGLNGIFDDGCGGVDVEQSSVSGNAGGVVCTQCSEINVESSTINANTTNGGIRMASDTGFLPGASMLVQDSTVTNNVAASRGGGISAEGDGTVGLFVTVSESSSVTDNSSGSDGGGIAVDRGSLFVTASVVSDNTAGNPDDLLNGPFGQGGGIFVRDGSIAVTTTVVQGNRAAGNGGGISHEPFSGDAATLFDVTLDNNEAKGTGGGIDVDSAAALNVFGATITNNDSIAQGGGIAVRNTAATIERATISGNNSGAVGGGLYAFESINPGFGIDLAESVVTDNSGPGAAVFIDTNLVSEVRNSTVSGNNTVGVAAGSGANLQLNFATVVDNAGGNVTTQSGTFFSFASVVADATGGSNCAFGGFSVSSGFNADTDNTCGFVNINDLPGLAGVGLAALADNGGPTLTHAVASGSPLLNVVPVAQCSFVVFSDQRGEPRPGGTLCDIGAYESQVLNFTAVVEDFVFNLGGFRFDLLPLIQIEGFTPDPASVSLLEVPDIGVFQVERDTGVITFGAGELGRIPPGGPIIVGKFELTYEVCDSDDAGLCGTGSLLLRLTDPATACTVEGTPRRDILFGTSGDDIICGFGGRDLIIAFGGNDVILAGRGKDIVFGGRGNDIVRGESGRDLLFGQRGTDWLDGGPGRDRCFASGGATVNCERRRRS